MVTVLHQWSKVIQQPGVAQAVSREQEVAESTGVSSLFIMKKYKYLQGQLMEHFLARLSSGLWEDNGGKGQSFSWEIYIHHGNKIISI